MPPDRDHSFHNWKYFPSPDRINYGEWHWGWCLQLVISMRLSSATLLVLFASLASAKVYFEERFNDPTTLSKNWKVPEAPLKNKAGDEIPLGQWAVEDGVLKTTEDSRFYELTSKLSHPFTNKDQDLVVQLTVRHPQQIDCGGGYIKLLGKDVDQKTFSGEAPYLLMFGPDICGTDRKVHVILTYKENHYLIKKSIPASADKLTHLYTLVIRPDQSYEVYVDLERVAFGTLAEDWDILPPRRIRDPKAQKPADWVDESEIADPEDKKPSDWDDEPEFIVDKDAKKPADWDDDMDGEWKPSKKPNPEYKGEWTPRKIPNPAYKGPWMAPLIDNPEHYTDDTLHMLKDISAVGFDLWQVKSGTHFDNILITDSLDYAKSLGEKLWRAQHEKDKEQIAEEDRKMREEIEAQIAANEQKAKENKEEQEAAEAAAPAHEKTEQKEDKKEARESSGHQKPVRGDGEFSDEEL